MREASDCGVFTCVSGKALSFTLAFKVGHGLGLEVAHPTFTEAAVQRTAASQTGCVKMPPAASAVFCHILLSWKRHHKCKVQQVAPPLGTNADGLHPWPPTFLPFLYSPICLVLVWQLIPESKSYGDNQGLVSARWSSPSVFFSEMRVNKKKIPHFMYCFLV